MTQFEFATGAPIQGSVAALGFFGTEEVSRLFSFDVLIQHKPGPLSDSEVDSLFGAPCAMALTPDDDPDPSAVVRGLVTRVRALGFDPGSGGSRGYLYVITVAPSVHLLTLGANSRVFQNMTAVEIATGIFDQYGFVAGQDYRVALASPLPRRDYVVQYQESDWDFIQRRLEYEGCYYWFEHGSARDVVVIADSNGAATPIAAPGARLDYGDASNEELAGNTPNSVFDWQVDDRRVPARVRVVDYNYENRRRLRATASVESSASSDTRRTFGTVVRYADNFKTDDPEIPGSAVDSGARLARLRAERIACTARIHSGTTGAPSLRAGHSFALRGLPETHGDVEFLVTGVEHRGGLDVPGAARPTTPSPRPRAFTALRLGVQFRPELRTAWPRIHGVVPGHVSAYSGAIDAQMDDQGRYRVKLLFDMASSSGDGPSCPIRLAEPYAGQSEGSHHPLRKGTEVLIAHIDGDPDRPVIVGAVPNTQSPSPTTRDNATQSVILTPSGIRIELENVENGR